MRSAIAATRPNPNGNKIAVANTAGKLKDGKMKSKSDIVVGLETFPETLLKFFNDENFGKVVLRVAGE